MKLFVATTALICACSPIASPRAEDSSIAIKDLHVGLDMSYLRRTPHALCDAVEFSHRPNNCFTVGGSPITNLIGVPGDDGKISAFRIDFAASNYDEIKTAIAAKFPSLTCTEGSVQNKMGAKFVDETCVYKTVSETLSVQKYGSDLTTGWVYVASNSWLDKQKEAKNKKKADI